NPKKSLHHLTCFSRLAASRFAKRRKQSVRRRTAAIRDSTRRKGPTRLRALPPAWQTWQLVGIRSLAIPTAASTPLWAPARSYSTWETKVRLKELTIRPSARHLFCLIPLASTTRPSAREHL